MAKGMREIKRQIKSKQSTMQITKAMEMVAAAKLKRSQDAAIASRPYTDKIKEVISSIASSAGSASHPMLVSRPIRRTAYLVITSERGLAGGYNSNVLRKTVNRIREAHQSSDQYSIFVIGRKGRDFFRRRGYPVIQEVVGVPDSPRFSDIKSIAAAAVNGFVDESYDELYLVYNEFVNAGYQVPVVKQLIPLAADDFAASASKSNYEYEPSAEEVLDVLLPKYAETLIYSALLEGKASEFGARMTAMNSATKNAKKMIADLTLSYNRARQAAITQEISEIVGGANALS